MGCLALSPLGKVNTVGGTVGTVGTSSVVTVVTIGSGVVLKGTACLGIGFLVRTLAGLNRSGLGDGLTPGPVPSLMVANELEDKNDGDVGNVDGLVVTVENVWGLEVGNGDDGVLVVCLSGAEVVGIGWNKVLSVAWKLVPVVILANEVGGDAE